MQEKLYSKYPIQTVSPVPLFSKEPKKVADFQLEKLKS